MPATHLPTRRWCPRCGWREQGSRSPPAARPGSCPAHDQRTHISIPLPRSNPSMAQRQCTKEGYRGSATLTCSASTTWRYSCWLVRGAKVAAHRCTVAVCRPAHRKASSRILSLMVTSVGEPRHVSTAPNDTGDAVPVRGSVTHASSAADTPAWQRLSPHRSVNGRTARHHNGRTMTTVDEAGGGGETVGWLVNGTGATHQCGGAMSEWTGQRRVPAPPGQPVLWAAGWLACLSTAVPPP